MTSPTKDAAIFALSLRPHKNRDARITFTSGLEGTYLEPTSHDGRSPCNQRQVILQPKKNLRKAQVARQTWVMETTLVRSGDRTAGTSCISQRLRSRAELCKI